MKLTKRQLKRIIREEYSRLKRRGLIREGNEEPSLEDLEKMIANKKKNIQTLESYRGFDPSIDDQIELEMKAKSDLIALYKKVRDGK